MDIKISVTNHGTKAVRFLNVAHDCQIDLAVGESAVLELASGTALIDMRPLSEATQKSLDEFQRLGSLGG